MGRSVYYICALLSVLVTGVAAQAQPCKCARKSMVSVINAGAVKPQRVFRLSNGITLGLFGAYTVERGDTLYTQFAINVCGADTVIGEGEGYLPYTITKRGDTVVVSGVEGLATGKDMSVEWLPFYEHKIYGQGTRVKTWGSYRKDIARYSQAQIDDVIAIAGGLRPAGNYDTVLHVGRMLFWAYVSGSGEAEQLLVDMPRKFGPFDGAISEEWREIYSTYEHWKTTSGNR